MTGSVSGVGRLHQLHEDPAGVLGVDEVNAAATGTDLGGVVEQTQTTLAQRGTDRVDVLNSVGQLLNALTVLVEELRDVRFGRQRGEELNVGVRVARIANRHHRFAHALFFVRLLVSQAHSVRIAVERDRLVKVGDSYPDVVDRFEQMGDFAVHKTTIWFAWSAHSVNAAPSSLAPLSGVPVVVPLGCPCGLSQRAWNRVFSIYVSVCRISMSEVVVADASADRTPVLVAGARTPMGRLLGSLKSFSGADLGGFAIKGAIDKAGIDPAVVQYVIMGQVLTAGAGQIPARQAAVKGGLSMNVPALTINKVCLSGLDAVALAAQLIRAGEFDVVVAGGQESMTNAPHLLEKSREGYKYGDVTMRDHMAFDGLWDAFTDQAMGNLTEQANRGDAEFTREEQDAFSADSHRKAAAAWERGLFDEEVVAVEIPQRKGDPIVFKSDEGIRPETTPESLAKLRPAFSKDGTITAGSASQISDGACALVVMSKAKAEELGAPILAELGAHGVVAGPDSTLQAQPANAIARACEKEGISATDLDVVEINEAFAAVGLTSAKQLGLDAEKVNPNGGAIAMGHPIGMSGARLVLTLALELQRRGGGVGAAALCGGGGQGDALIVKVADPQN